MIDIPSPRQQRLSPRGSRRRVIIAGAGVAALEVLLALRAQAGTLVDVHVVTPGESFVARPASVADCFDPAASADIELASLFDEHGAVRTVDTLDAVDTDRHTVHMRSGQRLRYDELVIAVGGRAIPAVPGALVFRGRSDVPALRATLDDLAARRISQLIFVMPAGNAWPMPLYDLALMTADFARQRHLPAQLAVVTAEQTPLERFGEAAGEAVAGQLRFDGIDAHYGAHAAAFRAGILSIEGDAATETLRADRVVALPLLRGPRLSGLPGDADGFLPIDDHGRIVGLDGHYAAGDATDGEVKNGALAAAQADAVAAVIAQRAGAAVTPQPFRHVVRGLLLTGGQALYVRASLGDDDAQAHDEPADPAPAVALRRRPDADWPRRPLWWPPTRAAGRYLAPLALAAGCTSARSMRQGLAAPVELTLLMADHDAHAGDYAMALYSLECAEALCSTLPAQYASKRSRWRAMLAERAPQAGCAAQ